MKTVSSKWPELVVSVPSLYDAFKSRGVDLSTAKVFSVGSLPSLFHLAYLGEAPTCLTDDGEFNTDTPLPVIEEELVAILIQAPAKSSQGVEVHGVVYSKKAGLAVLLVRWSDGDPIDISEGFNANHLCKATFYGGKVNGLVVHAALTAVSACSAPKQLPTFEDRHMTRKYKGMNLSAKPVYRLRARYHRSTSAGRSASHRRSEHERLSVAYVTNGDKQAAKYWSKQGYKKYTRRNLTGEMISKLADRGRRMPAHDEFVFVKSRTIPAADVTSS